MEDIGYGPTDMSLWLQRPLGPYEKIMTLYCPPGPGPKRCNVNNIATFTVNAGHSLDIDHFKTAVMATIYNEPNLRADMNLNVNPEVWVPATDFSDVSNYLDLRERGMQNVNDLMPFIVEEANRAWQYGSGRPLYRCTLVRTAHEYVVMNCYHHAAGDGISGVIIMGGIMKQYNLLQEGKKVELAPQKPRESVEDITNVVQDDEMVKKMIDAKVHRAKNYEPFLPLDADELAENDKNHFPINKAEFRSGTSESFDCAVRKCKEHGVTVGSLYFAASYLATAAMHALNSCPDPLSYRGMKNEYLDIAVDARRRISPPIGANYCSFYVTFLSIVLDVNLDSSLWELAKEVDTQVKSLLSQQQHLLCYEAIHQWTTGEHKELALETSPAGVVDLCCSSLGKYPFEYTFPWGRITANYVAGGLWPPIICNQCFVMLSTDRFHYSLVYCPGDKNSRQSLRLFDIACQTMESVQSDMTLRDILMKVQEEKQ